jgi:hypothetical protein
MYARKLAVPKLAPQICGGRAPGSVTLPAANWNNSCWGTSLRNQRFREAVNDRIGIEPIR